MIIGVIIFLVGMVVGYFLRPIVIGEEKIISDITKKLDFNKKGVVVDLTPPVDLGEITNEEEKPIK